MVYEIVREALIGLGVSFPVRFQQLGENECDVIGVFVSDVERQKSVDGLDVARECLLTVQFKIKTDVVKGLLVAELIEGLDAIHKASDDVLVVNGFNCRTCNPYKGVTSKGLHLFSIDFTITYRKK